MSWIGNILTQIFEALHSFVNIFGFNKGFSYGLTIVFFTAIIRILLLPINIKQTKSQAKMQEIQPLMTELQKKYKNDPQKAQAELSKLYKENGANPLGGCLPLLIQMPIFIAMYSIIRNLQGTFNTLNEGFTPLVPSLGATHNLVLAVLSAVLSYFSMSIMMPKNSNNPQAATANTTNMVMTVFSGFITYTVAAGLGVYWVSNSFFQLVQNLFMKKMGLIGKKPVAIAEKDMKAVEKSSVEKPVQRFQGNKKVDNDKGGKPVKRQIITKDVVKEISTDKINSKKNKGKK
ncbi:MAG: membrane protein insertase YidC [Bacillota bacterium]|nr:membrane protein insertase YidC [Bacillota bacterium]